jgi:hypothetical protein
MDKEQVLRLLETHRDRVAEFAVKALFWLDSVARSHISIFILDLRSPHGKISRDKMLPLILS